MSSQVQESVLRQQLGMPPSTSKHDITKAGLDLMEMERQRLSAEKVGDVSDCVQLMAVRSELQ